MKFAYIDESGSELALLAIMGKPAECRWSKLKERLSLAIRDKR